MSTFKPGDRIRRIADPLTLAPIGYETIVVEPDPVSAAHDVVWFEWPGSITGKVHSPASVWELVADEPVNPVRAVTRLEIVTGQYGQVSVIAPREAEGKVAIAILRAGMDVGLNTSHWHMDAAALRAAARVFNSLAEALEETS